MHKVRLSSGTGGLVLHGHLPSTKPAACCLLLPRQTTPAVGHQRSGHVRIGRPDPGCIRVAASDNTAAAYQTLVDLLGGGEEEDEEEVVQLPADMAAVLGHMLTDASLCAASQRKFCINCGRPLHAKQPCACGYLQPSGARDTLIDPDVISKWKDLMIQQQIEQQLQTQKEPPPKGLPVSIPARQTRTHRRAAQRGQLPISLVFHERMIEHRTSLPPHPERPERLAAILTRLLSTGVAQRCQLVSAKEALDHEIYAVHQEGLINAVAKASEAAKTGIVLPDGDATTSDDDSTTAGAHAMDISEVHDQVHAVSDGAPGDDSQLAAAGASGSPVLAAGGADQESSQGSGTLQLPDSSNSSSDKSNSSDRQSEEYDEEGEGEDEGESSGYVTEHSPSMISADSLCSPATYQAARFAAGASVQLVRQLMTGQAAAGMALIRPPGHQATEAMSQSSCFFNNAAIAAAAAQDAGAERVLILDWDVHHGQGTQALFKDDPSVLFISMHRFDEEFYPFSGVVHDVGEGDGTGYTINIPWKDNDVGDADYLQAMVHVVLPVCYQYQPDLVIISAGFSAAAGDPIGGCRVTPAGFAHMTHLLKGIAPVAMLLEGGYNLDVTARCVEACVRVLLGDRPPAMEDNWEATKTGAIAIMNTMQIQSQYWSSVHPWSLNGWMEVIREQQEAAAQAQRQALAQQTRASGLSRPAAAGLGSAGLGSNGQSMLHGRDDEDDDDEPVWVEDGDEFESGVDVGSDIELLQAMMELGPQHSIPTPSPSTALRSTEEVMPAQRAGSPGVRAPTVR